MGGCKAHRHTLTHPPPAPTPQLTLWDKHVISPGQELEDALGARGAFPVLAAKSVRVGDFNGKNLSTLNSTMVRRAAGGAPGGQRACVHACVHACAGSCVHRWRTLSAERPRTAQRACAPGSPEQLPPPPGSPHRASRQLAIDPPDLEEARSLRKWCAPPAPGRPGAGACSVRPAR